MTAVFIGALVIGLTLGLLGSGGSAITVPVLVYLVGHQPKQSIAESMAIVGIISIVAAIPYAKSSQVDWRSVLYFGLPGMVGTFIGAWLGGLATEPIQLIVFGAVLLAAAYAMLRDPKPRTSATSHSEISTPNPSPIGKIALEGTTVGIVTGFVGVGGGFLIVPALVIFGNLPIRLAIGTSLVIIGMKGLIGFAKYQHYLMAHDLSVDTQTILIFVLIGVAGSAIGKILNTRMNQKTLKTGFGMFLVAIGCFVIINEGSQLIASEDYQSAVESFKIRSVITNTLLTAT
ncbi:MAG: sulfite exporter TauE/SafE family protein [Lacipirellulaceae bacterium]